MNYAKDNERNRNDIGILDAYEVLANMQEIAEFQQEESSRRPLAESAA